MNTLAELIKLQQQQVAGQAELLVVLKRLQLSVIATRTDPDPWEDMSTGHSSAHSGIGRLRGNLSASGLPVVCFVTGTADDKTKPDQCGERVVAAHIWPNNAAYPPPVQLPCGVSDSKNGLFLLHDIEVAFDHRQVCFLCDPFALTITFKVLDPSLRPTAPRGCPRTFGELDGTVVEVTLDQRPSFVLLGKHVEKSTLYAVNSAWMTHDDRNALRPFWQLSSPQSASVRSSHGAGGAVEV